MLFYDSCAGGDPGGSFATMPCKYQDSFAFIQNYDKYKSDSAFHKP